MRKMTAGAALLALVSVVALAVKGCSGAAAAVDANVETYTVRKGELIIDVLEAGTLEASQSQVIRSEVEGENTIISIIPEGTIITEEDIKNERVLVQLDSSKLEERLVEQEIKVQGSTAQQTEAKEGLNIRLIENDSNLKQAELNLKFAAMDIDKYLGETVASLFLENQTSLGELLLHLGLGGEAKQRLRGLDMDIQFAVEDETRAKLKLEWTEKLAAKGYVQPNDVVADQSAYDQKVFGTEKAKTEKMQFERYNFPMEAENWRTNLERMASELERTKARNRSELAKAEVNLNSKTTTLKREREILDKVMDQLDKCKIVATQPGLVVYVAGSSRGDRDQAIGEGVQVRQRREIIRIPNTTAMQVRTSIHESVITRVKVGQKALITVDALLGRDYHGTVAKVALLPDSQRGGMWARGGGSKVYLTKVTVDELDEQMKPGMSAQVRIITNELYDVLTVPIQSVGPLEDKLVCFVDGPNGVQIREVVAGEYNDKFIEIKEGLQDGEAVVLYAAQLIEKERMRMKKVKGKRTSK